MTTVLVIEDSLEELHSLSQLLDSAGYNVVLTVEPTRALNLCNEINFDAVVCDLHLKDSVNAKESSLLTGMAMLWSLVDQHPQVPVIAVSRDLNESTLTTIRKLGAAAAIPKPLDSRALIQELEHALIPHRQ